MLKGSDNTGGQTARMQGASKVVAEQLVVQGGIGKSATQGRLQTTVSMAAAANVQF